VVSRKNLANLCYRNIYQIRVHVRPTALGYVENQISKLARLCLVSQSGSRHYQYK
jgi:hypothetical protein